MLPLHDKCVTLGVYDAIVRILNVTPMLELKNPRPKPN